MQVLGKLSGLNKATSMWIPGYKRILRNKVGKLAKERTNKVPVDQTASIPFTAGGKKNHHE